jgi:response regulator RpfG family c-di-GMP phosphodiesterase
VEVLSKYLQSANPRLKDRATRVAELCQKLALEMYLPPAQIDNIRVAALMLDLGKIEVTTRLVTLAVETLESESPADPLEQHSFHGMDLVHSLGSVLKGAIPLLASQGESAFGMSHSPQAPATDAGNSLGATIIHVVRAYDALTGGSLNPSWTDPQAALAELDRDGVFAENAEVRAALERVVLGSRHRKCQLAMAD